MIKQYYEAHVTMLGEPESIRPFVEQTKWKFSAIAGDANLGDGVKCYATRQMNTKIGNDEALKSLHGTADWLEAHGVEVIRRKIEIVIFDDRSASSNPATAAASNAIWTTLHRPNEIRP